MNLNCYTGRLVKFLYLFFFPNQYKTVSFAHIICPVVFNVDYTLDIIML